ncbi:MAG TPA: hypothetical protein VK558_03140, partial [Patescibacteria group bacterium]|nr:hypothetical protein [Patescibacteria group bacterium]
VYDRQRARVLAGGKALRLGWSWPAFGGWFVWFWYRKMWRLGALALLLPVVGGAVFPGGDVVGYLLAVSLASDSYVSVALRNRLAAEAQGLTGEGRAAFLAARGGVSWWGGTVGMVLMMGLAVADMTAHGDAILTTLVGAYDQLQAAGVIPPSD